MKKFTIKENGFYGYEYKPEINYLPNKAIIVLGGGGMPFSMTEKMAKYFQNMGILSIALGYFNVEGTSKYILETPVEYVERAVSYLKEKDYKVIVYGISKGAEYALAAASFIKDIDSVIVSSAPSKVCMGVGKNLMWMNQSSWSYKGKPLPYAYTKASLSSVLHNSLKNRELTFRDVYKRAFTFSNNDCDIKIENINGSILFLSSKIDSMWDSYDCCEEMMERLKENHFIYPYNHIYFEHASHVVFPIYFSLSKIYRSERVYKKECDQMRMDIDCVLRKWIRDC